MTYEELGPLPEECTRDLRLLRLPDEIQVRCLGAAYALAGELDMRRLRTKTEISNGELPTRYEIEWHMSLPAWIESILDTRNAWPVPVPERDPNR